MFSRLVFLSCIFSAFLLLKLGCAFPQWSAWAPCLAGRENCTKRILVCDENSTENYQCHIANKAAEELRINCISDCEGNLTVKEVVSCSRQNTKFRLENRICLNNPRCVSQKKIACETLHPCNGEWEITDQYCHAPCNESGAKKIFLENFSYFPANETCIPVLTTFRTRIEPVQSCTSDEACNEWSAWKVTSDCSASCDSGVEQLSRRCLNGTGGVNASQSSQNVTSMIRCNTHPCPSWTSWTLNETCINGIQLRSRACFFRGRLSITCSDSNTAFETSFTTCSSSAQPTDVLGSCDRTFYFITLPLISGFLIIVAVLLVSSCLMYRRFRRKDFKIVKVPDLSSNFGENSDAKERFYNGNTESEIKMASSGDGSISSFRAVKADLRDDSESLKNANGNRINSVTSQTPKSKAYVFNGRRTQSLKEPNVTFQRIASYPDLLKDSDKSTEKQEEQHVFKPRPSVRRAERLKLKEERQRRMQKKIEQEDLTWNETHTLGSSVIKEPKEVGKSTSLGSDRKRSNSVDLGLKFEFKPAPLKPSRRRRDHQASYENVLPGRDRAFTVGVSNAEGPPKDDKESERRKYVRSNTVQAPAKPKRNSRGRVEPFSRAALGYISRSTDQLSSKSQSQFLSSHSLNEDNFNGNETEETFS